ncbi:MAG: alpha/beta fold hydrolase [Betaproteobacteria bacterium]
MAIPIGHRLKRVKRKLLCRLVRTSPAFAPVLPASLSLSRVSYRCGQATRALVAFLPGIEDVAEDFQIHGFIDTLGEHDVAADAMALDAHYGYYANRTIHDRLTTEVIVPAQAAGYEKIWLVGISLGGFGALSYAARHPKNVAGLVLLAPYLGDSPLISEIKAAGGLNEWSSAGIEDADYQRALWGWIKHDESIRLSKLPVYLGFGERDAFATANRLLAELLPREHVITVRGGHDWATWKTLWKNLLSADQPYEWLDIRNRKVCSS